MTDEIAIVGIKPDGNTGQFINSRFSKQSLRTALSMGTVDLLSRALVLNGTEVVEGHTNWWDANSACVKLNNHATKCGKARTYEVVIVSNLLSIVWHDKTLSNED